MKKYIAPFLTLLMSLYLLASCGKQPPATTSTADVSGVPTASAAQTTVDTKILKEADEKMLNTYTVIAVNPEAPFTDANGNSVSDVSVNTAGADALIHFLLTKEALDMAGAYGVAEYGDALFYVKDDAPVYTGKIPKATDDTKVIRLSTTTSVNDSGLLDDLLTAFEKEYGYTVEVQSAGTGKAIAAAKYGNADLILVHSKSQEETFVKDGFARVVDGFDAERVSFIYNYFVLCGPSTDPAGVASAETVLDAFAAIANGKYPFISRGDGSGTHTKELSLWPEALAITEEAESFSSYSDWYISANAGMGACLVMAEEKEGYILTDKATFLTFIANNGVM
ncbi:MAG: substrate-binding domain-containing protein [Oscillospiraceae bacterium]|nr:substrate-binding domain-containing protein [Oscillospiraceae bacterium]